MHPPHWSRSVYPPTAVNLWRGGTGSRHFSCFGVYEYSKVIGRLSSRALLNATIIWVSKQPQKVICCQYLSLQAQYSSNGISNAKTGKMEKFTWLILNLINHEHPREGCSAFQLHHALFNVPKTIYTCSTSLVLNLPSTSECSHSIWICKYSSCGQAILCSCTPNLKYTYIQLVCSIYNWSFLSHHLS